MVTPSLFVVTLWLPLISPPMRDLKKVMVSWYVVTVKEKHVVSRIWGHDQVDNIGSVLAQCAQLPIKCTPSLPEYISLMISHLTLRIAPNERSFIPLWGGDGAKHRNRICALKQMDDTKGGMPHKVTFSPKTTCLRGGHIRVRGGSHVAGDSAAELLARFVLPRRVWRLEQISLKLLVRSSSTAARPAMEVRLGLE